MTKSIFHQEYVFVKVNVDKEENFKEVLKMITDRNKFVI